MHLSYQKIAKRYILKVFKPSLVKGCGGKEQSNGFIKVAD